MKAIYLYQDGGLEALNVIKANSLRVYLEGSVVERVTRGGTLTPPPGVQAIVLLEDDETPEALALLQSIGGKTLVALEIPSHGLTQIVSKGAPEVLGTLVERSQYLRQRSAYAREALSRAQQRLLEAQQSIDHWTAVIQAPQQVFVQAAQNALAGLGLRTSDKEEALERLLQAPGWSREGDRLVYTSKWTSGITLEIPPDGASEQEDFLFVFQVAVYLRDHHATSDWRAELFPDHGATPPK